VHEVSLCQRIIEIVTEQVATYTSARIIQIDIEIGQLLAVDKAALLFGFEVVARGTVAENARLNIHEVAGLARCNSCHETVTLKQYYEGCSACGEFSLTILQGEALYVQSMEVQ
jgi:hydrogenase nickel incorporation protein HypA/HybF